MSANQSLILNHQQIIFKLERMACQICEIHIDTPGLVICGLNKRGFFLADLLHKEIHKIMPEKELNLVHVSTTESGEVAFDNDSFFHNAHVLVVDDVINTGKTLMHVVNKIFNFNPTGIETAFLAKREHRNFPVKADYVGVSLATTLLEHVVFDNDNDQNLAVFLN